MERDDYRRLAEHEWQRSRPFEPPITDGTWSAARRAMGPPPVVRGRHLADPDAARYVASGALDILPLAGGLATGAGNAFMEHIRPLFPAFDPESRLHGAAARPERDVGGAFSRGYAAFPGAEQSAEELNSIAGRLQEKGWRTPELLLLDVASPSPPMGAAVLPLAKRAARARQQSNIARGVHPLSGARTAEEEAIGALSAGRHGTERDLKTGALELQQSQPVRAKTQKKKYLDTSPMLRDVGDGLNYEAALLRASEGRHLRKNSAGGDYIGAPAGVRTKAHMLAARKRHDDLARLGAHDGMDWYDETADEFERQLGTVEEADRLARAHAHTSAQTTPMQNADEANKIYNSIILGHPRTHAPTRVKAEGAIRAHRGPEKDLPAGTDLSLKVGSYRKGISPKYKNWLWGANDIWHARVWGFKNKDGSVFDGALNKSQHEWMDAESILAAERLNQGAVHGRTDWVPHRAQAATWVGARAAEYMKQGASRSEALTRARGLYQDSAQRRTLNIMLEAHPGSNLGHLPELESGSPESIEYSQRMYEAMRGGGERDVLYEALGIPQRSTTRAVGVWEDETNPAYGVRPQVGSDTYGPGKYVRKAGQHPQFQRDIEGRRPQTEALEAARITETMRGITMGQHGIGASIAGKPYKERVTGYDIVKPEGAPFTTEEVQGALGPVRGALELGGDRGFVSDLGEGRMRATTVDIPAERKFAPTAQQVELFGSVERILQEALPGTRLEPIQAATDYFAPAWGEVGSGDATRALIELTTEYPEVVRRLSDERVLRMFGNVLDEMARQKKLGHTVRGDIENFVKAGSQGGLQGINDALTSGAVLPATVLAFLHTALGEESDEGI